MTSLRSVWHLILTTYAQQQNIPIPGLRRQPIDGLSASELERLTLRAVRLRRKWCSPTPVASQQLTLQCNVLPTRLGVFAVHFLPRNPRYLLSVALISDGDRVFNLQCWDLEATPPAIIAMRSIHLLPGIALNSAEEGPGVLAIQSLE
jgi:hypothetical protein